MKLPNGSGTVYKLSDTRRRRPWVACAPATRDEIGDLKKRTVIGYYATQPEARAALVEFVKHPVSKPDMTIGELYAEWSAGHYQTISKSMTDGYNACWKRVSVLANEKVRNIRTGQLQALIDCHSELSHSSLNKDKALMSQLMDYAVQNDIIDRNYAAFVRLPRTEQAKKDAFNDIELAKIKKAASAAVQYADLALIMCYTGFRIGEFLTLTRFSYDAAARIFTGGSKTEAGRDRVVPIHQDIIDYVEKWVNRGGDVIFCRHDGNKWADKHFRESAWYPMLENVGVRRLTPHATRHTFATLLSKGGAATSDVQKLIGHADYSTTANIYTHPDLDALRGAIEKIVC
ncbi:hypothetical protein FACS1894208_01610 [Clostridia bacterium]|nr:hypothetical protein FACS1894208_01610 [Clostridia bacterium]